MSNDSVTGRDGYIIAKALTWALEYTKTLPDHEREWSDEKDMRTILTSRYSVPARIINDEQRLAAAIERAREREHKEGVVFEIGLQEEMAHL